MKIYYYMDIYKNENGPDEAKGKKEYTGDDGFANGVKDSYNEIKKGSNEDKAEIEKLENSKKNHLVVYNKYSKNKVVPMHNNLITKHRIKKGKSISSITVLNGKTTDIPNENGTIPRTLQTSVSHEMSHQFDFNNGDYSTNRDWTTFYNTGNYAKLSHVEIKAVQIENRTRHRLGLPLRTTYIEDGVKNVPNYDKYVPGN